MYKRQKVKNLLTQTIIMIQSYLVQTVCIEVLLGEFQTKKNQIKYRSRNGDNW